MKCLPFCALISNATRTTFPTNQNSPSKGRTHTRRPTSRGLKYQYGGSVFISEPSRRAFFKAPRCAGLFPFRIYLLPTGHARMSLRVSGGCARVCLDSGNKLGAGACSSNEEGDWLNHKHIPSVIRPASGHYRLLIGRHELLINVCLRVFIHASMSLSVDP